MLTTDAQSDFAAGQIVLPDDHGWDAARQAFNLAIDQRPTAVAFPSDTGDVASLVRLARERELRIAPQQTGHNAGPLGSLEDTLLLNTSELGGIHIDPERKRVRVGAGTKWMHVTERLSDMGLAALHGSSPDVGIVGYSLGGGMGWLARKLGLQSGSVTAVELVTADGRLVRADTTHDSDLFWALRGGGGNFGVVTAIEFDVYPIERLYSGAMLFEFEQASQLLHTWNGLLPTLPEELMSWATLLHLPDVPFVPEPMRGGSFAVVMATFLGDEADGRELLSDIRAFGPIMDTFERVPPFALAELAMDPPDPLPYLTGHQLLEELPTSSIDPLVAAAGPSSQLVMLQFRHMGGAIARPGPDAGARATLPGNLATFALGLAVDEDSATAVGKSMAAVEGILAPSQVGRYASFVEEPADAREFFDAETWARLRQVKAHYDPSDLFRGNHHVPPAGTP